MLIPKSPGIRLHHRQVLRACLLGGLLAVQCASAQFDSASTGANGVFPPIAPPTDTDRIELDLRDGSVTYLPTGQVALIPNTPADGFADGVLNFTTVEIPADTTVSIVPNLSNTPVTMLAQGRVNIVGTLFVGGRDGGDFDGPLPGEGGRAGPGGAKGGNGQLDFDSERAGFGLGPGGGGGAQGRAANDTDGGGGGGGGFATEGANGSSTRGGVDNRGATYGTPANLPLVGGSGGGGGTAHPSVDTAVGGGGGGGGGGLLVATSDTITVTGRVDASGGDGGDGSRPGASSGGGGGGGSGGALRLVANTIEGTGTVTAAGGAGGLGIGRSGGAGGQGRVRIEAFTSRFAGTTMGSMVSGSPGVLLIPNQPSIRVVSVGAAPAPVSPQGVFGAIDVLIDSPGTVTIELAAARVPVDTRIVMSAKPEQEGELIGPLMSEPLVGSFDASTTRVDIDFPSPGVYFLEARASFNL